VTSNSSRVKVTNEKVHSSVQHLSIYIGLSTDAAKLKQRRKNLRTLECFAIIGISCAQIFSLLNNNPLNCTEEISLGIKSANVPQDLVTLVCNRCPNPKVRRVLMARTKYAPKYDYCSGVIRDFDRWLQVTKRRLSLPYHISKFR
jgi:hypothetical protein